MWVSRTVSTCCAAMPAAAKLSGNRPSVDRLVARTGVNQRDTACELQRIRIHRNSRRRGLPASLEHPFHVLGRSVRDDAERSLDDAVAQG